MTHFSNDDYCRKFGCAVFLHRSGRLLALSGAVYEGGSERLNLAPDSDSLVKSLEHCWWELIMCDVVR